ncbi:MAG: hypothetical protein HY818_07810 [Acetobacterium woodii]|nr:hypothetical protein [Acetobacterium woodii]
MNMALPSFRLVDCETAVSLAAGLRKTFFPLDVGQAVTCSPNVTKMVAEIGSEAIIVRRLCVS